MPPLLAAGTYYHAGERAFWAVHGGRSVVVRLAEWGEHREDREMATGSIIRARGSFKNNFIAGEPGRFRVSMHDAGRTLLVARAGLGETVIDLHALFPSLNPLNVVPTGTAGVHPGTRTIVLNLQHVADEEQPRVPLFVDTGLDAGEWDGTRWVYRA